MKELTKISPIIIIGIFFLFSCHNKTLQDQREEARKLFEQSADLISQCIENVNNAKDSMEVSNVNEFFEKKITDINFSVPPKTDLKLSEQENDSLFKLLQIYKKTQIIKLKELSIIEIDSIDEKINTSVLN